MSERRLAPLMRRLAAEVNLNDRDWKSQPLLVPKADRKIRHQCQSRSEGKYGSRLLVGPLTTDRIIARLLADFENDLGVAWLRQCARQHRAVRELDEYSSAREFVTIVDPNAWLPVQIRVEGAR